MEEVKKVDFPTNKIPYELAEKIARDIAKNKNKQSKVRGA